MNKYLNEVPAVMAIFYDLDWNDGQWSEKMIECASRVQSMRYEFLLFKIYLNWAQLLWTLISLYLHFKMFYMVGQYFLIVYY